MGRANSLFLLGLEGQEKCDYYETLHRYYSDVSNGVIPQNILQNGSHIHS